MKMKQNEGFSLLETLIAMVLLSALVIPTCASMTMSFRINQRTDELTKAQLAVSSAVETLMATGISTEMSADSKEVVLPDEGKGIAQTGIAYRCGNYTVIIWGATLISQAQTPEAAKNPENYSFSSQALYYDITVTDKDGLVSVDTTVRKGGSQ